MGLVFFLTDIYESRNKNQKQCATIHAKKQDMAPKQYLVKLWSFIFLFNYVIISILRNRIHSVVI